MLFKPKYCCNCGEVIERLDWGIKTSRRFCEICETEFVIEEWAATVVAVLAVLCGVFGTAWLMRPAPPPVAAVVTDALRTDLSPRASDKKSDVADGGPKAPEKESEKRAFMCGAPTKKGTACTRRVAANGERCWQHRRKDGAPGPS